MTLKEKHDKVIALFTELESIRPVFNHPDAQDQKLMGMNNNGTWGINPQLAGSITDELWDQMVNFVSTCRGTKEET